MPKMRQENNKPNYQLQQKIDKLFCDQLYPAGHYFDMGNGYFENVRRKIKILFERQ